MRRAPCVALVAFGVFLALSASLALVVVLTLLWPQSPLADIWLAKPAAFARLLGARPAAATGFALLAAILAVAAVRWHRRQRLGWSLALLVVAVNLAADVGALLAVRQATNLLAACIDGPLLAWLLAPATRSRFPEGGRARLGEGDG